MDLDKSHNKKLKWHCTSVCVLEFKDTSLTKSIWVGLCSAIVAYHSYCDLTLRQFDELVNGVDGSVFLS